MNPASPIVFIVDDDLSSLRATARRLTVAGFIVRTFSRAEDLLDSLDEDCQGCIVADLRMPGLGGLDLQEALVSAGYLLPVVFLTGYGDIPSSVRAMRNGAEDFIEKIASTNLLIDAVQRAIDRDSASRASRARQKLLSARIKTLTTRECQVLSYVVRGRLNKQIATELGIHERTVKLHRTAITAKLGVRSMAELTSLCHEAGLFKTERLTFP